MPGLGHAAMPTTSQPRRVLPCAAPLGEAWYLEVLRESATDDAIGVHGTAWCARQEASPEECLRL